jgi:maltose alpha-D-glucosyltransferase/alpha-amylase
MTRGAGLALLEQAMPAWLMRQRWFGAKTRKIQTVRIPKYVVLPTGPIAATEQPSAQGAELAGASTLGSAIFFVEVVYDEDAAETYQVPFALSTGRELEALMSNSPQSVIASLATPNGPAALHDATAREDFRQGLLRVIEGDLSVRLGAGAAIEEVASAAAAGETMPAGVVGESEESLSGCHSSLFAEAHNGQPLTARVSSAEQSNTSILYEQKMIMKLFRKLQAGENPDIEIGRFLTEIAHFTRIAPFLGDIALKSDTGDPTALAMLQELIANEGDGWKWTLDELARFYESVAGCPAPKDHGEPATFLSDGRVSEEAVEKAGLYLEAASLLGRRTAELHLALATETHDEAFQAEPQTRDGSERRSQRRWQL